MAGCNLATPESQNLNEQGYPLRVDSKGHEIVLVPPGTFLMGISEEQAMTLCLVDDLSETRQEGWCEENLTSGFGHLMPQHEVTIDRAFWIDVYEVTNAQFRACEEAGVCEPLDSPSFFGWEDDYYGNPELDNYPVMNVRQTNAQVFCRDWRGGRLPTEEEWEYAARGTDGRLWSWGNEPPTYDHLNYWRGEHHPTEAVGHPTEVGSYPAGVSPFGLYDMAGNTDEWTSSLFEGYPSHPESDFSEYFGKGDYVGRDGDFTSPGFGANSVWRATDASGFRCVADSE